MFVVFSVEVRFVRRPFSCVFWLWVVFAMGTLGMGGTFRTQAILFFPAESKL